jgi:OPA family glycerol-3-phosphate transporter-like MFS transporter
MLGFVVVVGLVAAFSLNSPYLGWVVIVMSMAIIGVHGMLSGTASMDFGGRRNVGTAVGLIDGMVYLGTALQSIYYGTFVPQGDSAKDPSNWTVWPVSMIPVAALGFFLAIRLWNAKPNPKAAAHHEVKVPVTLTAEEVQPTRS